MCVCERERERKREKKTELGKMATRVPRRRVDGHNGGGVHHFARKILGPPASPDYVSKALS